jgi:hypothetical protein
MSRPITMDHLRSSKKPVRKTVWIALDSDDATELEEATRTFNIVDAAVNRAKANGNLVPQDTLTRLIEATDRKTKATEVARENSVKFVFRSLGRRKYDALLGEHPPTDEQMKKQGNDKLEFNPETFPEALVQACLIEPELSIDEVKEIFNSEDWTPGETYSLFMAAMQANQSTGVVNLGKD